MSNPNAVILFRPEAYSVGERVKGRQAAGASFLKGFVRSAGVEKYHVTAPSIEEGKHFAATVHNLTNQDNETIYVPYSAIHKVQAVGMLYQPDPLLGELAWWRRRFGQRLFSLCGVAHTTATQAVMRGLLDLVTAPVQEWDAVICPSQAVKSMITRVVESYAAYLSERFGVPVRCPVRFPVIPLGVNADEFTPTDKRIAEGRKIRQRLGIEDDAVVALFMGRLDPSKKISPEITYRVLERAQAQTDKKLHMIWCGWFADDQDQHAFMEGVRALQGKVNVHFVDGQMPAVREHIWHASDVFLGLVENIQETFGIAPVEAMAAGLPVIVTDWDGFKETVEDGVQGYRIPTRMLPAGKGERIAWRYESYQIDYGQYLAAVSQTIHIDVARGAEALARLADDTPLRRQMGQAGIERVSMHLEWAKIVPQYQALWRDLGDIRATADECARGTNVPRSLDPFDLFAGYPTGVIAETQPLVDPDLGTLRDWPPGLGMAAPPDAGSARTLKDVAAAAQEKDDTGWLWAGRAMRAKDRLD